MIKVFTVHVHYCRLLCQLVNQHIEHNTGLPYIILQRMSLQKKQIYIKMKYQCQLFVKEMHRELLYGWRIVGVEF